MAKNVSNEKKEVKEDRGLSFSPKVIALIADEVARRLPSIPRSKKRKKAKAKK